MSFFSPSYPKSALGIEQGSITALSLSRSGRRVFSVKQAASIGVPDIVLRPSFTQQNILNFEEMLVSLSEVSEAAGLRRQKKWSVSLPSNAARAAILTLDSKPASKLELEEVINWKAERSFGSPAVEMRLSIQELSPDREGKGRYFASAVRLDVLEEYETLFDALGWNAGLILPRHVSEAHWLMQNEKFGDVLLISSQKDGLNAVLLRHAQPSVIRSVSCLESEKDDEIFRLLMFYKDRMMDEKSLDTILPIGQNFDGARLNRISQEALGKPLHILSPADIGLQIGGSNLSFDQIAAPAGLASLAWN